MKEEDPCKDTSAAPIEAVSEGQAEESAEERIALAQSRSGAYGFLAAVFNQLPDITLAENIRGMDESGLSTLFSTNEELPKGIADGLALIRSFIVSCQSKTPEDIKQEISIDRVRLMRGVRYTHGAPPPYETLYVEEGQDSHETLKDVRKSYGEAGVAILKEVKERADYIGIELGFMSLLAEQESAAWSENKREVISELVAGQRVFLLKHLADWVPKYCQEMFDDAATDFYRGIARLLDGFIQREVELLSE